MLWSFELKKMDILTIHTYKKGRRSYYMCIYLFKIFILRRTVSIGNRKSCIRKGHPRAVQSVHSFQHSFITWGFCLAQGRRWGGDRGVQPPPLTDSCQLVDCHERVPLLLLVSAYPDRICMFGVIGAAWDQAGEAF